MVGRKKGSTALTPLELQIMQALWDNGKTSIREIQESFPEVDRPPYTSIQSIVYRLAEQGTVRRVRKIGNTHLSGQYVGQEACGRIIEDLLSLSAPEHRL